MKGPHAPLTVMMMCALVLTACSPKFSSTPSGSSPMLLVSEEERDGRSGPEAAFEGVLVVTDDNCLRGKAADGTIFNVEFPAGTHFNDTGEIDMGFATVAVGEEVLLGGGYSEDPTLASSLPEPCRTGHTFRVYSA